MNLFKLAGKIVELNFKTVWFNLYHLPLKQAIRFPILLKHCKLVGWGGKVKINCEKVQFGMIRMGEWRVMLYGNGKEGINWQNKGVCIFNGAVNIGSGSAISIGEQGVLEFGDDIKASYGLKIVCYKNVRIGRCSRFGWDNIVMDTDFHEIFNEATGRKSEIVKPISIGDCNWVGSRVMILKGTETPAQCIVGSGSLLNKKYKVDSKCLIAGVPGVVQAKNIYRTDLI